MAQVQRQYNKPRKWILREQHFHWPMKLTLQASLWELAVLARRKPHKFPIVSQMGPKRKLAIAGWASKAGTPPRQMESSQLARVAAGCKQRLVPSPRPYADTTRDRQVHGFAGRDETLGLLQQLGIGRIDSARNGNARKRG